MSSQVKLVINVNNIYQLEKPFNTRLIYEKPYSITTYKLNVAINHEQITKRNAFN